MLTVSEVSFSAPHNSNIYLAGSTMNRKLVDASVSFFCEIVLKLLELVVLSTQFNACLCNYFCVVVLGRYLQLLRTAGSKFD